MLGTDWFCSGTMVMLVKEFLRATLYVIDICIVLVEGFGLPIPAVIVAETVVKTMDRAVES